MLRVMSEPKPLIIPVKNGGDKSSPSYDGDPDHHVFPDWLDTCKVTLGCVFLPRGFGFSAGT